MAFCTTYGEVPGMADRAAEQKACLHIQFAVDLLSIERQSFCLSFSFCHLSILRPPDDVGRPLCFVRVFFSSLTHTHFNLTVGQETLSQKYTKTFGGSQNSKKNHSDILSTHPLNFAGRGQKVRNLVSIVNTSRL